MDRLITDIAYRSLNYYGEKVNGDSFVAEQIVPGKRSVAVLSDGMGHGVKANILSTLTTTMILNFISAHDDIDEIAALISRMLPVNSVGKNYATFTITDFDHVTDHVKVIQYDNPPVILIRGGLPVPIDWEEHDFTDSVNRPSKFRIADFKVFDGDRLIMTTDGVTQSGQRDEVYRFGWGEEQLAGFASYLISVNNGITPFDIAFQIISKADVNDSARPSDDMSCAVIHFRIRRSMMLISCPPAVTEEYPELVRKVEGFSGEKIICGHPVAQIIAENTGKTLERYDRFTDPVHTPQFSLAGFGIVTEGMIVPNRVLDMLEHYVSPADIQVTDIPSRLCKKLLSHDRVEMIIGMRRTINSDPNMPDEFELRRNILNRIAGLLDKKFGKEVKIQYL